MLKSIYAEIYDRRRCILGESPTSYGAKNEQVMWVDILGGKVLFSDLSTSSMGEFLTNEHISFVIPRQEGGEVLGTRSGPILRDFDGNLSNLPIHTKINLDSCYPESRWNDAKVSPYGDLWLGTMTYNAILGKSNLYRYSSDEQNLVNMLDKVTISNGMCWSLDRKLFYYIDSEKKTVDVFKVSQDGKDISNRAILWNISKDKNIAPDGMTIDSDNGIWVALWGGSRVVRLDNKGKVTAEVVLPVKKVTSCCFVGSNSDKLLITTAHMEDQSDSPLSGMTFICEPGVQGVPTIAFPY
jgi:sugar lactone lactonase YvrE